MKAAAFNIDGFSVVTLAIVLHALIMCLAPLFFIHSMHSDTTEIIYWGREWLWGYSKHPPLGPRLLDLFFHPGQAPILTLLVIGQVCVAISAYFVWRTIRLFANEVAAAIGLLFYLAAPVSTFFAVQINHNSLLEPFWAAAMFFGLRYFEQHRWSDALALSVTSALGILTKYEIAMLLGALILTALIYKPYRRIFLLPATYACGAVFLVAVTPHFWWAATQDHSTIDYALGARHFGDKLELLSSSKDFVIGHLAIIAGPALAMLALRSRMQFSIASKPRVVIGLCLITLPSLLLYLGALFTEQDVRQGWLLPMTANFIAGLVIFVNTERTYHQILTPVRMAALTSVLALANCAFFLGFLEFRLQMGKPVEAFDVDTRTLAHRLESLWVANSELPLSCIVIDNRRSSNVVLWLRSRPLVVNLADPEWSRPAQISECKRTGGIAVLHETTETMAVSRFCLTTEVEMKVQSALAARKVFPHADLFYIPPEVQGCGAPYAK